MNVNATLFIQMINFFIVYWMLRLFLFKPIVAIIQHEEVQEKALLDIIDQQKKSLDIQEQERQRNWHDCQDYFIRNRPSFDRKQQLNADFAENNLVTSPSLSADTIAAISADVRTALEEKIKHVH